MVAKRTTSRAVKRVAKSVTAVGASGGSAFDPSQLTGLELWLDASDTDTVLHATDPVVASDGETVRQWLDKSGNDRHANQTTGVSQPLLDSDGLGSKPALIFDGSNDFFVSGSVGDWNFLHDGTASLVVAVVKFGTSANPDNIYTLIDNCGFASPGIGVSVGFDDRQSAGVNNAVRAGINRGVNSDAAATFLVSGIAAPVEDSVVEVLLDGDNATASQRLTVAIDGSTYNESNSRTSAPSSADSTYTLNIGRSGAGSIYAVMALAELIVCSDQNAVNRVDLLAYLSAKWGVALA